MHVVREFLAGARHDNRPVGEGLLRVVAPAQLLRRRRLCSLAVLAEVEARHGSLCWSNMDPRPSTGSAGEKVLTEVISADFNRFRLISADFVPILADFDRFRPKSADIGRSRNKIGTKSAEF